jgi:hypothetical protein
LTGKIGEFFGGQDENVMDQQKLILFKGKQEWASFYKKLL